MNVDASKCVCIHTYPKLWPLTVPGSNDTPRAMSVPEAHLGF